MKNQLKITLPFKTPSINHLYGQHGFRKFLTKEAKELRGKISSILASIPKNEIDLLRDQKLRLYVGIYEDWQCKNGSVARKDISNREKFLIDSIFESFQLDDKFIFEHIMTKVQSKEEKAVITLELYA